METARKYETVGCTDEADGCDCCGRMNLKRYIVMREIATGEHRFFGTGCAAIMEGVTETVIRREVRDAEAAKAAAERAERNARSKAEADRWFAFLDENAGPGEAPDQITRLGGFAAARAAFRDAA